MDWAVVAIVLAIAVNIAVAAFGAGKVYSQVSNLRDDVKGVRKEIVGLREALQNTDNFAGSLAERVARIEGQQDRNKVETRR